MNWIYLLVVFLSLMILRVIVNFYKLKRIKALHTLYHEYLRESSYKFVEYKQELISLFKDAGLKDFKVMHQEFLGFGQFANMQISGFENLTSNRMDIANGIQSKFHEAIGVFRKKALESLNPIFWIEFILKLPQFIFEFFGVIPEKLVVKVFILIYWIIAILFGAKKLNLFDYFLK